jgi:hypothetical protein
MTEINRTPIVGTIDQAGTSIKVHAATLRQVLEFSDASKSGDTARQLDLAEKILDACVEGIEAPSVSLDAATASRALAIATGGPGDDSPDPTRA